MTEKPPIGAGPGAGNGHLSLMSPMGLTWAPGPPGPAVPIALFKLSLGPHPFSFLHCGSSSLSSAMIMENTGAAWLEVCHWSLVSHLGLLLLVCAVLVDAA